MNFIFGNFLGFPRGFSCRWGSMINVIIDSLIRIIILIFINKPIKLISKSSMPFTSLLSLFIKFIYTNFFTRLFIFTNNFTYILTSTLIRTIIFTGFFIVINVITSIFICLFILTCVFSDFFSNIFVYISHTSLGLILVGASCMGSPRLVFMVGIITFKILSIPL